MQIGWSINSGDFAEGARKIHRRNDVPVSASRFNYTGPADKKGSAQGFFVHPAFVEPAMLSEVKALVGAVDDDGVLFQSRFLEIGKHASDPVVHRSDAAEVVFDIALVFPAHQLLPAKVRLFEGLVLGIIGGVPELLLFGSQVAGRIQFQISPVHGLGYGHILLISGESAPLVIVE